MNNVLSQEEINALLNETFSETNSETEDSNVDDMSTDNSILSDMEKDALGEIANISMGSAATTLSALLGKRVEITTPRIEITTINEVKKNHKEPYVVVDVLYNAGLTGSNIFVLHTQDASVIVDLMMGGEGTEPPLELNELHLSAISEAMNQMMGSSSTSLSQILKRRIDIAPPTLNLFSLEKHDMLEEEDRAIVKISFNVTIQDLVNSELMQLLPVSFAKDMASKLIIDNGMSETPAKVKPTEEKTTAVFEEESVRIPQEQNASTESYEQTKQVAQTAATENRQERVAVSPVQFEELKPRNGEPASETNLDLILDVGLQLSVELGRTTKKIKDILEFTTGSVFELDKIAGEPVDILINNKLLAKGEVVVIDENFGVRVTEIISRVERVKSLK